MIKLRCAFYLLCVIFAITNIGCATKSAKNAEKKPALERKLQSTQAGSYSIDEADWPDQAREVLVYALRLNGIRYQYGGNTPESGFDCSGFVRYVFQQASNLNLPHSAKAISQIGQSIPRNQLQAGDLVFFNTLSSAFSHVGIYLGNNRFIHAPTSGGGVRVEDMQKSYWQNRFDGAQRIETAVNKN